MARRQVLSVLCPSCGRPSAIAQHQKHGRQVARCRHCKESFFLYLANAKLTDVIGLKEHLALLRRQMPKSTH